MGTLLSRIRSTLPQMSPGSMAARDEHRVRVRIPARETLDQICLDFTATHLCLTSKRLNDNTLSEYFSLHQQPESVSRLELNDNDNITIIPQNIGRFHALVFLDLKYNYICEIPWSIVYLKQLEVLDLSYNNLLKFIIGTSVKSPTYSSLPIFKSNL